MATFCSPAQFVKIWCLCWWQGWYLRLPYCVKYSKNGGDSKHADCTRRWLVDMWCTHFDNSQPRRNLIKIVLIGKRTLIVFDPKYSNCSLDSCSFQLNINIIVQERGTFDPLLRGPSIRPYTTVQLDTGAHLSQKFKSNFSKFYDNFLGGRIFVP